MKFLIVASCMMLGSCGLLAGGGLDEAVAAIERSDLPADVKQAVIEALKEAWAGNGLLGTLRGFADVAVGLILAKFGLDKTGLSGKLFGKKAASEPAKPA